MSKLNMNGDPRTPITEWRMAVITALRCWQGTSIAEGAFHYIERARVERWGQDDAALGGKP